MDGVANRIGTGIFVIAFMAIATFGVAALQTVEFPAPDGVTVTADLYLVDGGSGARGGQGAGARTGTGGSGHPFILLCHQAGASRGEYRSIAPRLNEMGFNCLAVDQRSGGAINGVINRTARAAKAAGKPRTYLDAYQDIVAASAYIRSTYGVKKIIIWGSSYSASLVIRYAAEYPDTLLGVLAFSPGEYYVRLGKGRSYVRGFAARVTVPVFIASARNERSSWQAIYNAVPVRRKHFYLPKGLGRHGSSALWPGYPDAPGYWDALERFLGSLEPAG